MGRKRLSPEQKRIGVHITLPKKIVEHLKTNHIIISQLVEELVKKHLNKK
jgi:post-segregation antitoxin (ccd killing protein)